MPKPTDLPSIDGKPEDPDETLARADGQPPADSGKSAISPKTKLQQRGDKLPDGHPSSPRNEDGTSRPVQTDVRQLGASEETDQQESTPTDTGSDDPDRPAHPAHPDTPAASADDGTSKEWRAELPRLRDLWERHKECWPAKQRAPVDRSTDEEGSWRGDGARQYLNVEESLSTEHALDRVSDNESELTGTLQAIEAEVPGTRLVGLAYRIKGMERFKEKVATELRAKPDRSIAEITGRMPDAVRYTYQCDEDSYAENYKDICSRLEASKSELIVCRNYWDDPDYKGVNTRWLSANGQVFEAQFHTADSFQAKQLTHSAYERLRTIAPTSAERPELESFQQIVTSHVRIPVGVETITNYRRDGY